MLPKTLTCCNTPHFGSKNIHEWHKLTGIRKLQSGQLQGPAVKWARPVQSSFPPCRCREHGRRQPPPAGNGAGQRGEAELNPQRTTSQRVPSCNNQFQNNADTWASPPRPGNGFQRSPALSGPLICRVSPAPKSREHVQSFSQPPPLSPLQPLAGGSWQNCTQ